MIQVNQVAISEQQILSEMQYHPAASQREAMIKAAESLIISELVRQRAQQAGLLLSEEGEDSESLLEQLLQTELALPQASEQDCFTYYQANPARFISSPRLQLQHILVAAAPDDEIGRIEARQLAEKILIDLHLGSDFAQQALQHSACPSKHSAGDLGVICRGDTVPELERQLLRLPLGLHPSPLESRYGFHVVKVNHISPGEPQAFAQVKDRIAEYLQTRVKHKAIAQFIQQLINEADIEGFDFSVSGSPLLQ